MAGTHGKDGSVHVQNENGFIGAGVTSVLNDLTAGVFSSALDSAYFEIEIDAVGTPDTFKWRANGGAWTEGVAITGAAQTLAGANGDQIITFGATTGHTVGDKWVIGNLEAEACTLDHDNYTAQITDAAMRILDPNNPPTFTDTGGANVVRLDYARGTAHFDADPTSVTVTGAAGYIPAAALEKVGYMYDWEFSPDVDLDETTSFGDQWKKWLAGLAGASGKCAGYFASNAWWDRFAANANAYFLLMLYTYDPDQDATGDHYVAWVHLNNFDLNAKIGAVVGNSIGFTLDGAPGFTLNS